MDLATKIKTLFPGSLPADLATYIPYADGTTYLINGNIQDWNGPTHEVVSPLQIAGEPLKLGRYPLLSSEEALRALEAAYSTAHTGEWIKMPQRDRIAAVRGFVKRMKAYRDHVVALEQLEIAKTKQDCQKEFDRTVEYIDRSCDALEDAFKMRESGIVGYTSRVPHGVTLGLGPFNYPVNEYFTVVIPALLMGNTFIGKGPRIGLLCTTPLYKAFADSFPAGVVNFINGDGPTVVTPIMQSGKVDCFAFIGSCNAYNNILKQHPHPNRVATYAGLEAKNYAIILPDADLEKVVKEAVTGALSFNGQRCTALKVHAVPERRAEEYVERMVNAVNALSVGMPWENPAITPMADTNSIPFLQGLVQDAVAKGAQVRNEQGGATNHTYFHPAVLYPITAGMRVFHEEQFGPVIPITTYRNVEEVVGHIQHARYGQQVSIFGKEPDLIRRAVLGLRNEVSRINLNTQCQRGPDTFKFGGRKDSSVGVLSISDALNIFSRESVLAAREEDERFLDGIVGDF